MNFVKIETKDFEELKELQAAYKVEIGEDTPTEEDFKRLYCAIENEEIAFYGCRMEGELVACCSISITFSTFNYERAGVFEDFYIKPEFRHKGIARKLVAFVWEQSGVGSLTVGCADCDVEMYKAIGFVIPLGNMLAFSE